MPNPFVRSGTAPRNEYILQVKSGGTDLLPGIERPSAFAETALTLTSLQLEQLLSSASRPLRDYGKEGLWIRTSGAKSAHSYDLSAHRSKSAVHFKTEEKVVKKTRRLHPLRSKGQEKKEKPKHHDDLELSRPSVEVRAPIQPLQRMRSLRESGMGTRDQIVAKANELQQKQINEVRHQGASSEEEFHNRLRGWLTGERRGVSGDAMREARSQIWESELQKSSTHSASAVKIQRLWRTHGQRSRYQTYIEGRFNRARVTMNAVFSLWVRVHLQRPMGRGGRSLLSFWAIQWRVEVRRRQIAREKARDLKALFHALVCKRALKALLRGSRAIRMQRDWVRKRGFEYWNHARSDQRIWKNAQSAARRRFIHHAFRVLLFHGRCSVKCRQRSYKLFRLEETSVHPLVMPVDRFRGYGQLFNCQELLERFRDKDWTERRVQRLCYVRLAPRVMENWSAAVEGRKMHRYATEKSHHTLLSREDGLTGRWAQSLLVLRELTALDENGERLHKAGSDSEGEEEVKKKVPAGDADMVKQLETDIDHLSGLVDHEHRENLRLKVKEEKRKMMVRIKFDALSKEREVMEKMPAEYDKSSQQVEEDTMRREAQTMQKQREEAQLLQSVKVAEGARWQAALDRVRHMWGRAVEVLEQVYDTAQEQRRHEVFLHCWKQIRRPAFKVRMRRIMNRGHMRRLLVICAHHRKMQRSIHKFRPLRLLVSSLSKWLKMMEESFTVTTPGLKARVRRRYELRQALSEQLEIEHEQRPLGAPPMAQYEMLGNINLVLAGWMECHCNARAYKAVAALMAARARARLLARAFEFLWLGKARVTGDVEEEEDEGESCFAAANASADLAVWRRCFFTGTRYATVLRKAAELRKRMAMKVVKASVRLAPLLWTRREEVTARIEQEQRLLIRHFDEAEGALAQQVGTSGIVLTGSYPAKHWSTVLNMRRRELMVLLDACDELAQRAHRAFSSAIVGYSLSGWLFRIRCNHLPMLKTKTLTANKEYWKRIKEMFQRARTGHLTWS